VEDKLSFSDEHGVARVIPSLSADDDVRLSGQYIDDFSLPLVTPLGTD
jgi:hypothetical protein